MAFRLEDSVVRGEIDNRKERFVAGMTEILQMQPFMLKAARAAFQMLQKH